MGLLLALRISANWNLTGPWIWIAVAKSPCHKESGTAVRKWLTDGALPLTASIGPDESRSQKPAIVANRGPPLLLFLPLRAISPLWESCSWRTRLLPIPSNTVPKELPAPGSPRVGDYGLMWVAGPQRVIVPDPSRAPDALGDQRYGRFSALRPR
jgi:hypothetical protein